MRRLAVLAALMMLVPAAALARDNVVPANPMTRDAVQVPLSFISYERRTSVTDYAAGIGFDVGEWLVGAAMRYHLTDKSENQLLRDHGPADALELELQFGSSGNLFSRLSLKDLCSREGIKPEDCVFSNLNDEDQTRYQDEGPMLDVPMVVLLSLGGSYQQLTLRDPADRSREVGDSMWGARARLGIGLYLGSALLGISGGASTVGAAPAQLSYCTALVPSGSELACAPAYLAGYNRTTIVDGRLEWRQAIGRVGFNPAAQAVFARSARDDATTANDDTVFRLRYVEAELPVYYYFHPRNDPGIYLGLRGALRWWYVDRAPREVELMGGVFVSVAYGGAKARMAHRRFVREFIDE